MPARGAGLEPTRRHFMLETGLGAIAVAVGGALYAAVCAVLPTARRLRLIRAGRLGDLLPGAWYRVEPHPIFVFATDRGVAALRARCTHLGCALSRAGDRFICPCHGSSFDAQGAVLSPPASEPLRWLHVSVINGSVYVDPDRVVAARTFVATGSRHA